MAMDEETQRHWNTWVGFVKFITYSIIGIVVVLGLMAIFLL
jgi:hypothetical protein